VLIFPALGSEIFSSSLDPRFLEDDRDDFVSLVDLLGMSVVVSSNNSIASVPSVIPTESLLLALVAPNAGRAVAKNITR